MVANSWQRRAAEIKEKMIAHIRFDMMNMAASKGDEDQVSDQKRKHGIFSSNKVCRLLQRNAHPSTTRRKTAASSGSQRPQTRTKPATGHT